MNIDSLIIDCDKICSSLSKKEQEYVGPNIINQDIVFLSVVYNDKLPIAFICIKEPSERWRDGLQVKEAYIILAVHPDYRHNQLATLLIRHAIKWFIESEYEQLIYTMDIKNIASENLAKKCGFTYGWPKDNGRSNVYLITNPNKFIDDINSLDDIAIDNVHIITKTANIHDKFNNDVFTYPYINMDSERDMPFLIINGKLIVGTSEQTHSELQVKYIQDDEDIQYVVYGHVFDDVAVIDYIVDDYNLVDEFKIIALLKTKFSKIYDMVRDDGHFTFTRIAY